VSLAVGELQFVARKIRDEKTGVHALVGINLQAGPGKMQQIAWTRFNVERDEDRTRLANSAAKKAATMMNGANQEGLSGSDLKHHLDWFCHNMWQASLDIFAPEELEGLEEPVAVEPLISPYVVKGGGTIMFAPPGRGKSNTALLLAVSVDSGTSRLFAVGEQTKVLFINLERSRMSLQSRLSNVNAALGLERRRSLAFINARGRSLVDVFSAAEAYIEKHQVGFVVLDSISRAGYGDLNENRPVNAIVDGLNQLSETWLGIAHTPRADDSHLYGSVHFEAGADVLVRLATEVHEKKLGIGLQVVKANDLPLTKLALYSYLFNDTGLSSAEMASAADFPELDANSKQNLTDEVYDYLAEVGKATASQCSRDLGRPRQKIQPILSKDPRFHALAKSGREVPYAIKPPEQAQEAPWT
jgi:hypothetical protein